MESASSSLASARPGRISVSDFASQLSLWNNEDDTQSMLRVGTRTKFLPETNRTIRRTFTTRISTSWKRVSVCWGSNIVRWMR